MRIKDTSKAAPKIIDTSKVVERVEPEEVAKALGAERLSDIEKLLKEKVEEAVKYTDNNRDRHYLIRWIMISAEMQGLIKAWRHYIWEDSLVYEIQVFFPIFPKLFITAPLVEK